jgi:dinuclear metal center YbgI/SA1388 family protein
MSANGQTIIQQMELFAPKVYAVPDDKIGLQIGTLNKPVSHVMVTLDVSEAVVDEAIANGVELIIAHHAVIYRPLKDLRTESPQGRVLEKCIKHNIAVYVAHTNLDVTPGGINDMLANAFELNETQPLDKVYEDQLMKLVVYVPSSHLETVSSAVFAAGAGEIGKYAGCGFSVDGMGTFTPGPGSNPYIGQIGIKETLEEIRFETVFLKSKQRKIVQAMIKAHPYDEVAYDIFAIDVPGVSYGLGRVGKLPHTMTLGELIEQVKERLDVPALRYVGNPDWIVKKMAVLGGSGGRYVNASIYAGADVLLTGDIDYHTAQDAEAAGLALIDPGHHIEKIMKGAVADVLRAAFQRNKMDVKITASSISTEPFKFA